MLSSSHGSHSWNRQGASGIQKNLLIFLIQKQPNQDVNFLINLLSGTR